MSEYIADARKEFERAGEISNHAENLIEEAERLTKQNQELIKAVEDFNSYCITDVDYIGSPFHRQIQDLLTKIKGEA